MISFTEFLAEHYITTDIPSEKAKYHDAIHHMLKTSYASIGDYAGKGHDSEDENRAITSDIMNPNHVIKLKKVAGTPVAVKIYKKSHGRKSIAAATNGSDVGKEHLKKIMKDDIKDKRSWGEVSGAMEHLNKKFGAEEIPNTKAKELTGKEVNLNPDNSYDRQIGDKMRTKRLMGTPGNEWKSK